MIASFRLAPWAAAFVGGFSLLGSFGGCGPHCDPATCLQGNTCVRGYATYDQVQKPDPNVPADDQCRLICKAPSDCPFNYHCVSGGTDFTNAAVNYCVKDHLQYTPKVANSPAASAPWGVPCAPAGGLDQNPDCDTAEQFWCYGVSNLDANAFCTQFQCGNDGDCPGGWWCATVNDSPGVTAASRNDWGNTTTVCLPRTYNLKPGSFCAPCKSDLDCPKNEGTAQHCVSTDNNGGAEKACAVECTSDSNCPFDYACQASDNAGGAQVCVPRAATCIGDGTFCSPCHSDADCAASNGFCIVADYSTEHYCTTKSGVACSVSNNMLTAQCPATTGTPENAGVSCSYSALQFNFPKDQCFGLVNFGTGQNAAQVGGCWTKH